MYRPHCVRSVLTTSVKILPYRPPARLIRANDKMKHTNKPSDRTHDQRTTNQSSARELLLRNIECSGSFLIGCNNRKPSGSAIKISFSHGILRLKERYSVTNNCITHHTCSNSPKYLGLCGSSSQSHAHSIKQLRGDKHDNSKFITLW